MYATAARIERLKPPGRRTFAPWLFMLSGDVQSLSKGKVPLPWLGGAGVAAFLALYITAIFSGLDERRRHTNTPLPALAGRGRGRIPGQGRPGRGVGGGDPPRPGR